MVTKGTTLDEAKDLLSILPFVWGIVTAVLLGPAWRWSREEEKYHLGRSIGALVMSLLSTAVSLVVVLVMAPIGIKAVTNSGPIQGVLVLYELVVLSAIGATAASLVVGLKAGRHLANVIHE